MTQLPAVITVADNIFSLVIGLCDSELPVFVSPVQSPFPRDLDVNSGGIYKLVPISAKTDIWGSINLSFIA